MTDWYYEHEGQQIGPVSDELLKALVAAGEINSLTLVWSKEFGSKWKPLGETFLSKSTEARAASEPPPLPSSADKPDISPEANLAKEFLQSELTRLLIGRKEDYYLSKWTMILGKAAYDARAATNQTSWNWPAFFFPYGWFIYRKLYSHGILALLIPLASVLSANLASASVNWLVNLALISLSVVAALYGNSLYLNSVYNQWRRISASHDPVRAHATAKEDGGTNIGMAIAAAGSVLFVAAVPLIAGQTSSCGDPDVLQTTRRLFMEQELGPFIKLPAGIFALEERTATLASSDSASGAQLCNMMVRIDLLAITRLANPMSDEEFRRKRETLAAQGQSLIQERLITYQVQPLASGQRYITLLRH